MLYRTLGRTGLAVSVIGLGCVQLSSSRTEYAVQIVRRAVELGVNYFDVARGYGDAEVKLGLGLQGRRQEVYISTKTPAKTRDDAWRHVEESLERMGTDYVDNCHLHGLRHGEDLERRLGPGGALEALIEAREQGLVRHIGCSSHRSEVLVEVLRRFDFEVILVPMNIVEREPLDELIPLCRQEGVGVTIMKPLATGLLPVPLALKWLVNQPIATAVPGCTTLEELEENAGVGHGDPTLTPQDRERVRALKVEWEHKRCRICSACEPCPQDISIGIVLGTDVMADHYRTMGAQAFRAFPWSRERIERDLEQRQQRIALIESCTRCGECETKCPYGLPVMDMLESVVPAMKDMLDIYRGLLSYAG
jgi:predicted aldo/keto reductase-like oxidoreductase